MQIKRTCFIQPFIIRTAPDDCLDYGPWGVSCELVAHNLGLERPVTSLIAKADYWDIGGLIPGQRDTQMNISDTQSSPFEFTITRSRIQQIMVTDSSCRSWLPSIYNTTFLRQTSSKSICSSGTPDIEHCHRLIKMRSGRKAALLMFAVHQIDVILVLAKARICRSCAPGYFSVVRFSNACFVRDLRWLLVRAIVGRATSKS